MAKTNLVIDVTRKKRIRNISVQSDKDTSKSLWWTDFCQGDCMIAICQRQTLVGRGKEVVDVIIVANIVDAISELMYNVFVCVYRSLRCPRITLHMNLFTSFAANNALWLLWYTLVVQNPQVILDNGVRYTHSRACIIVIITVVHLA